jgi:hypothetical protein
MKKSPLLIDDGDAAAVVVVAGSGFCFRFLGVFAGLPIAEDPVGVRSRICMMVMASAELCSVSGIALNASTKSSSDWKTSP